MTGGAARLRAALDTLGWSGRPLAGRLRINECTLRRWVAGQVAPPPDILEWLERCASFVRANPPPVRVKRKGGRPRKGAQTLLPPVKAPFSMAAMAGPDPLRATRQRQMAEASRGRV